MSLATSCPACGTVFKVVEDQLKVSQGWVRCGHCHEVFNALEGLFDLEGRRGAAGDARTGAPAGSPGAALASPPGRSTPQAARPDLSPQGTKDSRGDWVETRPAMFSDIQALRARQQERDTERVQRHATPGQPQPGDSPPAAAWVMRHTSVDLETGEIAEPSREESPPASAVAAPLPEPAPALPTATTPPAAVQTESIAEPQWVPVPVHERAIEPEAAPARVVESPLFRREESDNGMADTVFLPHESSRFFDEAPPLPPMPPVDDDSWAPSGSAATSGANATLAEAVASEAAMLSTSSQSVPTPEAPALPDFVRVADRAAWWRRPFVQLALGLLGLLTALALVLQVALYQRDLVAARWPQLEPALHALCEPLNCVVMAPRLLDALVVENSSLTRPSGVDGYRLQVLLRNRAGHPVRAPNLELTLNDATGAVVVRRVLTPENFQQANTLAASSEGNWQLEMTSVDKRIAGFTVAAFYP